MDVRDHALLFPMSLFLWTIDPAGEAVKATLKGPPLEKWIFDADLHRRATTPHRASTSNNYRCSDGRWFQLHGSLNPDPVLDQIGLPHDLPSATMEDSWPPFKEKISQIPSADLLNRIANVSKQAGDICYSVDEYLASADGKANAHVGLFEMSHIASSKQSPGWWPSTAETSPARPLAGLKVVDLTRIIASPSITRGLAELGASVMRIMSPKIPDMSGLHIDLNWGKWNAYVDLKSEEGRQTLRDLILDADVVVNGYRPGVLDKYGLAPNDIIKLVAGRDRGIVLVRENCYGWHGPSSHRSGWQPVSDAFVGMSRSYGEALGLQDGEPVTPFVPNSDYSTGLIGVAAILCALLQRGEKGGSFTIDLALNYYNQWLARSVGTYPAAVWEEVWDRYGKFQFRGEHSLEYTAPRIMKQMREDGCFPEDFFETRRSGILDVDIHCVRPVISFPGREVDLRYNVGARGHGTDVARWPSDLLTEVVK